MTSGTHAGTLDIWVLAPGASGKPAVSFRAGTNSTAIYRSTECRPSAEQLPGEAAGAPARQTKYQVSSMN